MPEFDLARVCAKKPDELRNGDHCLTQIFENEKAVLLVLGDGVSNSACDWKASKLSCEQLIDAFSAAAEMNLPQRLKHAINHANRQLLLETGTCEGLKSTLSVLYWSYDEQIAYWANIGDSRIYFLAHDQFNQLSTDETLSVLFRKKNGQPILKDGATAVGKGITNFMGKEGLDFQIHRTDTTNWEAVVLASDGFYDCKPGFDTEITKLVNSIDLQQSLDLLFEDYKDAQRDDLSGLVCRLMPSTKNESLLQTLKSESFDPAEWTTLELATALQHEIPALIKAQKPTDLLLLLTCCSENKIDLGQKQISSFISLLSKYQLENPAVYKDLRKKLIAARF